MKIDLCLCGERIVRTHTNYQLRLCDLNGVM